MDSLSWKSQVWEEYPWLRYILAYGHGILRVWHEYFFWWPAFASCFKWDGETWCFLFTFKMTTSMFCGTHPSPQDFNRQELTGVGQEMPAVSPWSMISHAANSSWVLLVGCNHSHDSHENNHPYWIASSYKNSKSCFRALIPRFSPFLSAFFFFRCLRVAMMGYFTPPLKLWSSCFLKAETEEEYEEGEEEELTEDEPWIVNIRRGGQDFAQEVQHFPSFSIDSCCGKENHFGIGPGLWPRITCRCQLSWMFHCNTVSPHSTLLAGQQEAQNASKVNSNEFGPLRWWLPSYFLFGTTSLGHLQVKWGYEPAWRPTIVEHSGDFP